MRVQGRVAGRGAGPEDRVSEEGSALTGWGVSWRKARGEGYMGIWHTSELGGEGALFSILS